MSNSNQDSGTFGAVLAVGLLLVVGGGGFLIYQQNLARKAEAALIAEKRALEAMQQTELAAAAEQAEKLAASQRQQLPSGVTEAAETVDEELAVQTDIVSKLMAQQADWNKGDLDAFMKVYWNSEKLTFASSGKVTRGYQATLDGYKAKYSTKEKLGTLTFDNIEFQRLADRVMLVLGTWHLERGDDSVGGNFSLIWQKIDDQWVIVHDHTSALASKKEQP